jgi:hypothetical protein
LVGNETINTKCELREGYEATANNSRASVTSPVIAAAATINGLISIVRPVGLPWRPLKLRFDELAQS